MGKIIGCKFNMDTAYVELKYSDSSMIAINTNTVENGVTNNMCEWSELDYGIYNSPLGYAPLF